MKLYILQPVEGLPYNDNPWEPWFDKCFGMVIRAESEQRAREVATENQSEEVVGWGGIKTAWLDQKYSTCKELTLDGIEEIIITNVWEAN